MLLCYENNGQYVTLEAASLKTKPISDRDADSRWEVLFLHFHELTSMYGTSNHKHYKQSHGHFY
jgi:hypothetical protein